MIRNLKILDLAFLAICAFGALAVQGAVAAVEHEFHSDGPKTTITGKNVGTVKFAVGAAGTFECTTSVTEGTQTGTEVSAGTYRSDALTLKPTYSGCTFGGQPATFNPNHCAYVFDSDTTTGNPTGGEHANVETECSGGSEIEIDTSVCTITIAAQLIKHAVRYQNDPSSKSAFEIITTAHKVKIGKKKRQKARPAVCSSRLVKSVRLVPPTQTNASKTKIRHHQVQKRQHRRSNTVKQHNAQ